MIKSIPKIVNLWSEMVSERNPEKQAKLYSKNSILLATFDSLFLGRDGVVEYMIKFLNKKNIKCRIIDNYTQRDTNSNIEVANGIYQFSYVEGEQKKSVQARYTFVIKNNLIISHHSSVDPKQ